MGDRYVLPPSVDVAKTQGAETVYVALTIKIEMGSWIDAGTDRPSPCGASPLDRLLDRERDEDVLHYISTL